MNNLSSFLTSGAKGVLKFLKKPALSYKGNWIQVYPNTVLDRWHVGDFSTASYLVTIEYKSNKKELMHINVVARPDQASYNVFGRTSIDDELVTFDASVTNSIFSLKVSPSNTIFAGAKITFLAFYGETLNPLSSAVAISQTGGVTGGNTGTIGGSTGGNTGSSGGGTASNSFSSISVANQSVVVADSSSDTLTLVAGNNMTITTNALTDTITFSSTGGTSQSYSLPTSSTNVLGGVKVDGSTIIINGNGVISATGGTGQSYTLPTSSTSVLGGVKVDGSTITINGSGVISSTGGTGQSYTLPTASASVLGGVKVDGTTVTINGSGVITANYTAYSLPIASTTVTGGIKIDGSTLAFNGSGQLYYTGAGAGGYSLPTATTTQLGGVKVDGTTVTINGSGIITANYTTYSLPTATTSVLGGVKVDGTTVTISGSGVISASSATSIPTYPAITRLDVTNSGSSAYLFNNQYSGNNPTIYAISGTTIAFNLNVSGHPFLIRQGGANYDTGLIHVSTTGTVSTGASAQGQVSGTLYWQIPQSSAGTFGYLCQFHGGMIGTVTIKQISSLP